MREVVRVARGSEVYLGLDISSVSWHVTARTGGETVLTAGGQVDMGQSRNPDFNLVASDHEPARPGDAEDTAPSTVRVTVPQLPPDPREIRISCLTPNP